MGGVTLQFHECLPHPLSVAFICREKGTPVERLFRLVLCRVLLWTAAVALGAGVLSAEDAAQVVIQNPNDAPLRRYQVRLEIPCMALPTKGGLTLAFLDGEGKEQPHWVQETGPEQVVVWVRVADLPPGESTLIMRHVEEDRIQGDPGEETFLFFDDFTEGFDEKKWLRNRDASKGGVGAFVRDGCLHVHAGDNNGQGFVKSLVDLPLRLSVMARMKVERKNDYARGGFHLISRSLFEKTLGHGNNGKGLSGLAGVEYNYYTYSATPCPNRRCFSPMPMQEGVALEGYWQDRWFFQDIRYDGTREKDNFVYVRDDGKDRENVVATLAARDTALRLYIHPWAWWSGPNHRFTIDWIAVRELAEKEPTVRLTGMQGRPDSTADAKESEPTER